MPVLIPPVTPSGTLRYDWIDPDGVTLDLTYETSPDLFVRRGSIGLGTAGSEIADEKLPTAPGSVVRRIAVPATRIELPVDVHAATFDALLTKMDDLWARFDTGDESRRSPGYLQITRPDDSIRVYQSYYAGGLEGDLSEGTPTYHRPVISLLAPDPYPTAPANTVTEWVPADLPNVAQINEGQMAAYPIWKITGPATVINVGNLTTGKNWSLTYTLAAGKYVTVDTRPASQRTNLPVIDVDGVNRYPALYPGSQIFGNWLVPGTNTFLISLVGSSGASRVELRYLARYRGSVR